MIYYILIILSTICFAGQFAFTKLYERSAKQTTVTSLTMLGITGIVGALLFFCISGFRIQFSVHSFIWALVMAGLMIPYYMLGIKVLSLGSLATYSMFMMLGGMLVPFFYGLLFLHEGVSWGKIVGTVVLSACIVLQSYSQQEENKTETNGKTKTLFLILCLLIFFINGMTGIVAKEHVRKPAAVDEMSFTVLYCTLTAVLAGIFLTVSLLTGDRQEKRAQIKSILAPSVLLVMSAVGVAAHTGNFLSLKAVAHVPASVQFPIISGGTIVLSALASAFIFKEKISKKEWLCVAGAFLATLLFAF